MATAVQGTRLDLTRTYNATPEELFAAWTDPKALSYWFAPSDEYVAVVHALDLRVGGTYRIEMRHKNGASHTVTGTYETIDAPRRLSFTWRWEAGGAGAEETLVDVAFSPVAGGTRLTLQHTRFLTDESRAQHAQGWDGCLSRLPASLHTARSNA